MMAKAPALLDSLPPLAGLAQLHPMVPIMQEHIEASRALLAGRFMEQRARSRGVVELLQQHDPRDFEPTYAEQLRLGVLYGVALSDAALGNPATGTRLLDLQAHPGIRANAARARMVYELMHGNSEAASALRRRA